MDPVLTVTDVWKEFHDGAEACPAVAGISLSVNPGEIVAVMGRSGCGKSTLLRIILGLETADRGSVTFSGDGGSGRIPAAMVFQEHALFPWLTVRENVLYGLKLGGQKIPGAEAEQRVDDLLAMVELSQFASSHPYQLSGGMRQRVSVLRALAVRPGIILMDEPFSSLDPFARTDLEVELLRIRDESVRTGQNVAILFVTHNFEEAIFLADRLIVLSERPATIRGEIRVDLPHPRNVLAPEFLAIREKAMELVRQ